MSSDACYYSINWDRLSPDWRIMAEIVQDAPEHLNDHDPYSIAKGMSRVAYLQVNLTSGQTLQEPYTSNKFW
jgi:hypothetical protein